MYDENNIFAKILRSEIPCEKVYEDDDVLFFYDINPIAKIHVLGIPKINCIDIDDFIQKADEATVKNFFNKVSEVVTKLEIKETGYRLVTNIGKNGGQEVPHFHIHILGGEKIGSKL
tara:strand:- start:2549 stop:2899 length:351 start_codon:yes stop_codon:yes gene_type:complete